MEYFTRLSDTAFRATEHTSGAWDPEDQHIAPALGLLAHVVEADRDARRDDAPVVTRVSYDILGTVPVTDFEVAVEVLRPARTIELVEARLRQAGRDVVRLRAWLQLTRPTAGVAGTSTPPMPGPADVEPWDVAEFWPGGFIASVEVRRRLEAPGRGLVWVRSDVPLLAGEPSGPVAQFLRLVDLANGMSVREDPRKVLFPNLDLTAHLFRAPAGEWVGFDTTVSFGDSGIGLTSTVLHDEAGPVGSMAQTLTVRPL